MGLPLKTLDNYIVVYQIPILFIRYLYCLLDTYGGSDGKESACSAGDLGLIHDLGRSPGEQNGYPVQYSCLENPIDRGAWKATVLGEAESDTTE